MEARARHLEEMGHTAFFIRIEDIEDGFETAFEVGSKDAFDEWVNSSEEAWFFLDSIDEARLAHPRAFARAILRFANRTKSAQHRARIFISSRPYAWRPWSDRDLIERNLPFKKPAGDRTRESEGRQEGSEAGESADQDGALRVYVLDPLNEDDIRKFAEHRRAPQIDKLIIELRRANLMPLAARPFDLEGILSKWKADQSLDGRHELLQHNIELRLKEINPDRTQRRPISPERARRGARLLAAAVILTGEPGIRVPDPSNSASGIDAETVLRDWDETDVQALLERGLFNDVLYGIVRFRHREVRELLAAEWFVHQLKDGISRRETESLFFREQYGHAVITPRLRPVLPWLILFDPEIRRKALEISPEIAVEGGDAARLPFAERQALLHDIVQRISGDADDGSARDIAAIARIAQPDLTDDALHLINDHRDNDEAIYFLGRLVWQGEMTACVPILSGIAVDPTRGIYARIAATRAVMTCGDQQQKRELQEQLTAASEALPRRLLAEVVVHPAPDMASVNFLLAAFEKLETCNPLDVTGLRPSLLDFIDRLPVQDAKHASRPLVALVAGLHEFLGREPHIEKRECPISEEFAWLLGSATHAVQRLVAARSDAALRPDALSVMLKPPVAQLWQVKDFHESKHGLSELVPAWTELNDALFWRSVEEARRRLDVKRSERLIDVLQVQHVEHYWRFATERFGDILGFIEKRDLVDDKLVALSLAYRLFVQADRPDGWRNQLELAVKENSALTERLYALSNPERSQNLIEWEEEESRRRENRKKEKEERNRNRAKWVKCLRATPEFVRHPPGSKPGDFSRDQYLLLREIERVDPGTSRSHCADWHALVPEFGKDVAQAFRDAAIAHWRIFTPGLRSEGHDTSSIPCSLNFAMAGLDIEAGEVDGFPSNLGEGDVRHALRYIVWGFNGFPRWLESMHRAHRDIVLNAVWSELRWELQHSGPEKPQHYILHDLVYHAPWMHETLVPSMLAWMKRNEILNDDAFGHCINILQSGDPGGEAILELARSKIAGSPPVGQLAAWHALCIDLDAEQGIPAAEKWLSSLQAEGASKAAQLLITKLMGSMRHSNTGDGRRGFRNANDLKALYILMLRHIRTQDDINRANTGAYSPGLRDEAQACRSALLKLLCEIPGKESYLALNELARSHPNARYRPWMKKLAFKHAEQDADLAPWTEQQVRDHDQLQVKTPRTHRELYDLTVCRLSDLKDWIERGNDSPYTTWRRVPEETEMRNLIAGALNARSSGRYTCAQENEFPNRQRPDILIQSPQVDSPVPIELKLLDKGWSGPELTERLRNQLAGDYLREVTAGCGVFLLIWQGCSKQRNWEVDGKSVPLQDLPLALHEHWESVSDTFAGVASIKVILIDLTVRHELSGDWWV